MKGAWIISWMNSSNEHEQCVCSSLSVVCKLFPQAEPVKRQAYRNPLCIWSPIPDQHGRTLVQVRRVQMYRPDDVK